MVSLGPLCMPSNKPDSNPRRPSLLGLAIAEVSLRRDFSGLLSDCRPGLRGFELDEIINIDGSPVHSVDYQPILPTDGETMNLYVYREP